MSRADIHTGDVIKFVIMPQILPRIGKFFRSGFAHLPYFIVVVFNTLRIIPDNHIYLRRTSHGRFSLIQALAAAASHVEFNRKNLDKVAIFSIVLGGIVMMALQFVLLVLALFAAPAYATGPRTYAAFFDNPNPADDIAFRLLDLVFGVPNIFFSSDMGTTPFHEGFHALLAFYSYGMVLIGTIILVYLTMAIVMETAQQGVPFGQRFLRSGWAPVRIILFFGLLLPVNDSLNVAQHILLHAAKLGSNVATNAWSTFHTTANAPYLGTPEQLVARPNTPDLNTLVGFMAIARTCSWAEGRVNGRTITPYIITGNNAQVFDGAPPAIGPLLAQANGGTILVRFGTQNPTLFPNETGGVFPYCGELAIPYMDQHQPGSVIIQQAYLGVISCLWSGNGGPSFECDMYSLEDYARDFTYKYSRVLPFQPYPNMDPYIGDTQKTQYLIQVNTGFEGTIEQAVQAQIANNEWNQNPATQLGWAGAGIWFNKVAEQNGALTAATFAYPIIRRMPYVMEFVRKEKLKQDANTPLLEAYSPSLSNGKTIQFESPDQRDVALILNQVFTYWGSEHAQAFFPETPESKNKSTGGNIIIDTINAIMGTRGLYDLCRNPDVHPLAQLSALGRGLVEHSIRSFGMAVGFGAGAGILSLIDKGSFSSSLQAISSMFVTIGSIGLIIGFILFYVLPFLPFIYFFFAVMTWVKGIFEAMVGMPLWALAHLRIDGEGMPGQNAEVGYFYILETFLRPIFIIISFLGGLIIFSAMVKVLNQIFYLVIANLAGHTTLEAAGGVGGCFNPPGGTSEFTQQEFDRGPIDDFFFTVMYTIIVYMIALPCFKMVDLIPDRVMMRWQGVGVEPLGSKDGDPAENLIKYVAGGAAVTGSKLKSGFGFKS